MSYCEPNYTDLRMLDDGTRFHVKNGGWIGSIFSKDGQKYMHIDETGADRLLTGDEQLIITVLPKKKISDHEALSNLKYSIEHLPFTMFNHKEVFDRQEVLKLVNDVDNSENYNVPIHNTIIIPQNATNGDMIKALFPMFVESEKNYDAVEINFKNDWWNTPYESKEQDTASGEDYNLQNVPLSDIDEATECFKEKLGKGCFNDKELSDEEIQALVDADEDTR